MKIVIAGIGEMGGHLAEMLSGNGHDITVIDTDEKALKAVSSLADIITVVGDSTTFAVLRKASVRKCDLFVAVHPVENNNILSAIMAKQLGAKKVIARIDNNEYLEPNNKEMFINMGIDYMFYPEQIAAEEVVSLLGHTSTTEFVDFASGRLSLLVFRLEPTSPLVGRELASFEQGEKAAYRTVAILRRGKTLIPHGADTYMVGDVLYIIARHDSVNEVMALSGQGDVYIKNMMILGGSRIGVQIAQAMQNDVNVKLVDYNEDKTKRLALQLDKTLILTQDGRSTEAMLDEGLANMDAFVAVTGRSETNILAAMLAKRMGVKKVIAAVENLNYINLADNVGVDTIINKKMVSASNIFRFTMSTDVLAIKCLKGSDAEVLEFIVKPNSPATKAPIKDLGIPAEVVVGGVVRGNKVFIASGDTKILAYDRVVVFAMPSVLAKVGHFFN